WFGHTCPGAAISDHGYRSLRGCVRRTYPRRVEIYFLGGAAFLTFSLISLDFGSTSISRVDDWGARITFATARRRAFGGSPLSSSGSGGAMVTRCFPATAPSPSFLWLRRKLPSSWMVPIELPTPSIVDVNVTEPPASSFAGFPSSSKTTTP